MQHIPTSGALKRQVYSKDSSGFMLFTATVATMAEGVPAVLLPLAGMHLGYVPAIGGSQVPPVDR